MGLPKVAGAWARDGGGVGRPLELQLGFWVAADGRRKGKKFHSFPRRKTLPDVCTTKKMRLYVCFPYNNVCTFFAKKTFIIKLFGFFDGAQYLSCKPAGHSFLSSSFLPVPAGEGEEEEEVYCKVELPFKYPPLSNRRGEKTGMVLREISQFVPGPDLLAFLLGSH